MASHHLFSVVITNYNKGRLIEDSIRSAIEQRSDQFGVEIIVVDDGSTDSSMDHVIQFGDEITVVRNQKNSGALISNLIGSRVATGDYIVMLDGDDLLAPNALEALFESKLLRLDRLIRGRIDSSPNPADARRPIEHCGVMRHINPAPSFASFRKTGGSALIFPRQVLMRHLSSFPPIGVQDLVIPLILSLVLKDIVLLDCVTHYACTRDDLFHLSGNPPQTRHDRLLARLAAFEGSLELNAHRSVRRKLRRRVLACCFRFSRQFGLLNASLARDIGFGFLSTQRCVSACRNLAASMRNKYPQIRHYPQRLEELHRAANDDCVEVELEAVA